MLFQVMTQLHLCHFYTTSQRNISVNISCGHREQSWVLLARTAASEGGLPFPRHQWLFSCAESFDSCSIITNNF